MSPPIDPDVYELRERAVLNRQNARQLKLILIEANDLDGAGSDDLRELISGYLHDCGAGQPGSRQAEISSMDEGQLEAYLKQYKNHRPRLIELVEVLDGNDSPVAHRVRESAAHLVSNWVAPVERHVDTFGKTLDFGANFLTRPLFNKSLDDLTNLVSRNFENRAELDLVRCELVHRNSESARRLLSAVEQRIATIKTAERKGYRDNSDDPGVNQPSLSDEVRDQTNEAVAKLRAKLIDLSRKSPLISFKHTSRSASQLRIVDERPDLLWKALDNGSMGFEPLPGEDQTPADEQTAQFQIAYERARLTDEVFQAATANLGDNEADARAWQDAERALRSRVRDELGLPKLNYGKSIDVAAIAKAHGFDPSFELKFSDEDGVEAHHEDKLIRVLLTQKELDKRLKTIWDRAGTHLRETGLHTLHLIFGFVEWFEDDASDIVNHAPLLLMPVGLEREVKRGRYEYVLKSMGDELEVNIALIEKARQHWGIVLPELREGDTPESYFVRAKLVLEKARRLKFNCFVTLAVVPPMVLWKDLDPAAWPEDAFGNHRLLPGILSVKEISQSGGSDGPIDIDDPINADRVPALITDADASQHHAIMDMAAGHDMAIEGPPGTGKSQTITNMIATALSLGKKVLFVAEKQAALRVVADRLRSAGFGPLLLELHGDRAVRADVYDGIRERLGYVHRYDSKRLELQRNDLLRHRDMLRRYLALIRSPLGKLGRSANDLAWREIRLRAKFKRQQIVSMEARWSPKDPEALDQAKLTENRELLEQYGQALANLEDDQGERTHWARANKLNAFDQSSALDAAGVSAKAAGVMAEQADLLEKLGLTLPPADGAVDEFEELLTSLREFTCKQEEIVASALQVPEAAARILAVQALWQSRSADLGTHIENPGAVSRSAVQQLAGAMNIQNCPATHSAVVEERSAAETLCDALLSAQRDLERLSERLSQGMATTTHCAGKVASAIGDLGAMEGSALALLRRDLLDPAALTVAQGTCKAASDLLAERSALLELAAPEALKCEPGELEGFADTLEATGFFGRLGGHYRATNRQVARLLLVETERVEAAGLLRRIAALIRSVREFDQTHKAKQLFPALLWEGADSDFAALVSACELVSKASNALATIDEADALTWWLGAEQIERQRFAASCSRLAPLLSEASEEHHGTIALNGLQAACDARRDQLRALETACKNAQLRDDCALHWAGKTVAAHLTALHDLEDEFDELRSSGSLSWVGAISSDLSMLVKSIDEVTAIGALEGSADLMTCLKSSPAPVELMHQWTVAAPALTSATDDWFDAAERIEAIVETDVVELTDMTAWGELQERLAVLSADRRGAGLAADLLKYSNALAERGLSAFADAAVAQIVEPGKLDDLYELLSASALLRVYIGGDGSELSRLGSLALDAARKAFRKTDKELHKLEAAAIVAARMQDHVPAGRSYGKKSEFTDLGLIEREVELTRPRTPLRDVVHRAGDALQVLKPVWMMSPTSVAQFIRPGQLSFDLLIVDEASQMRPEYSLSCMLRADQFVVVGDANQLPPSDHFQMAGAVEDGDGDDAVGVDEATESILDLANQRFRKKPRLKWHYRSQHESLIQFSNREFYERDLIVFPSPSANDDDLMGVKCTYVPAEHPDTCYESSINQREAEEVIEQAFALMQRHPERSIGIVAMNAKQTELIQNEFDRLIVEEDKVRKYTQAFEGTVDEFFIKNLENVQGDERDIILISTVYGPGKDGKVRQNFGLMNREVGWRRLNVLVTRAKMSCRLITSLRPDDIKITENSSRGVTAFKAYLTYAHNGAQYDDASGGETDSDFEIFVADAIRGAGYEVIYQVGVENFRIDLGIRHPSCPIGFIAGIECDGATYHSGLSVRDRDHIRQSVLEGLGWKIYRVWSTDWFADAGRETSKLLAWLDGVRDQIEASLASRPVSPLKPSKATQGTDGKTTATPTSDAPVADVAQLEAVAESPSGPREPRGRKLRQLGDFDAYEAVRGTLFELWREDRFLGEVELTKHATGAARMYSDGLRTSLPEYEGRVESTDDTFKSSDLYAALREVASRANAEVGS